jgi:hypothetical protein
LTPKQFQAFWVFGDGLDFPEEEAVAAFEKMLTRPAFIDWLPITLAFLDQAGYYHGVAKENAENLREKIAASLGNDSTDRGK